MFPYKHGPALNLESHSLAKNLPMVFQSYPIKIWGNYVKGFMSYDEKDKQRLLFFTSEVY